MAYVGVKPAGISSASQVETNLLDVDNITIDGNTISSTDTNGDITLDPDGTGKTVVQGGDDNYFFGVKGGTYGLRYNSNTSSSQMMIEAVDDTLVASHEPLFIGGSTVSLGTSGTERLRIDSSGNVGIGTSSPSELLHVDNASGDAAIRIDGSTRSFKIEQNNYGLRFVDVSGGSAERMRLLASGGIAHGGTTQIENCFYNQHFAPATFAGIGMKPTTNSSYDAMRFNNNGGSRIGTIACTTTSTAYNTSSDYRLKEAVVDMTGAIDRVKALAPKRFQFIADADRTVDGFLAHEAQTVVPEAVTGTKDAMRDEEYEVTPAVIDDDGNVVTEAVMGTRSVPDYQGIDQSKLVPLLTGALQEAIAKIEALETRNADLTARIEALETA